MSSTVINHEWIKAQAAQLGCPVTDLLALARQNDPFYVGTPSSLTQARWFADVWEKGRFPKGVHLRRLHYWCLSQTGLTLENDKPYENTERCWQYLCLASKAARYLGLVPIADLADHKNPAPHVLFEPQVEANARFEIDTPDFSDPYVWINGSHGYNLANAQPYHLEVWVEKSTMNDVLLPVCKQYGVNLVTGEGEMTVTAVNSLVERIRHTNRPVRVFYISDFDPAGYSMPLAVARKIEFLLRSEGLDRDVKLQRLLLNREHVDQYALPRIPIKESERRAASFEARHGEGAVELDALEALHPGVLGNLVTGVLSQYYSQEAAQSAREQENALRQAIRVRAGAITLRYTEHVDALRAMNQELSELDIPNLDDYEPVPAPATIDDGNVTWLFDSDRSYLTQIAAYKEYARGDGAHQGEHEDAA